MIENGGYGSTSVGTGGVASGSLEEYLDLSPSRSLVTEVLTGLTILIYWQSLVCIYLQGQ